MVCLVRRRTTQRVRQREENKKVTPTTSSHTRTAREWGGERTGPPHYGRSHVRTPGKDAHTHRHTDTHAHREIEKREEKRRQGEKDRERKICTHSHKRSTPTRAHSTRVGRGANRTSSLWRISCSDPRRRRTRPVHGTSAPRGGLSNRGTRQ